MHLVVLATVLLGVVGILLGGISLFVGIILSVQSEVWLAHNVSPIWSGAFFAITGLMGLAVAKSKTMYLVLCFAAFSAICIITCVVSIQLLRVGLINYTTDGHTFQKDNMDLLIIISIGLGGVHSVFDLISLFVSWRFANAIKEQRFKKKEGTFHIQILGGKDIIVIAKPPVESGETSKCLPSLPS